jgi:hypothetical protein
MKKKVLFGFAVLVIAVLAAWTGNVSSNERGLSDISLANVEALANSEYIPISCHYYCPYLTPWWDCTAYETGSGEQIAYCPRTSNVWP